MGMRKISKDDELRILLLLRRWPKSRRVTWEALRVAIIEQSGGLLDTSWTRQALSSNDSIRAAYSEAKQRTDLPKPGLQDKNNDPQDDRIRELESDLATLQKHFDALKLRHTQLIYSASLLEGGTQLLDYPLPDNTGNLRI